MEQRFRGATGSATSAAGDAVSRPPAGRAARGGAADGPDPLPNDSPYALPPIIVVRTIGSTTTPATALGPSRLGRVALSPKARRAVAAHAVEPRVLQLLSTMARVQQPLLVLGLDRNRAHVQATTNQGTRTLLALLTSRSLATEVTVRLQPVSAAYADAAGGRAPTLTGRAGARAVLAALRWLGTPYSWGGGDAAGPTMGTCDGYTGAIRPCPATRTVGFDCSGLTLYAYAQAGVALDHYTGFQWLEGRRVGIAELAAGDLVFFELRGGVPGHEGIYLGDGRFVHAPHTGDVVRISRLDDPAYAASYVGAIRPY